MKFNSLGLQLIQNPSKQIIFKMKIKIGAFFLISLSCLMSTHLQSQSIKLESLQLNTITTAVPFLMICPESRAGGMGEAGVATSADANSIHWNSSKLAFADKQGSVSLSYTPWLKSLVPDISLAYLSSYYRIDKQQAIGASLRYFSLGNIEFMDQYANKTGDFKPNEFAFDLSYARKLSETFSGGMTLKYIYSNLTGGQYSGTGSETYRAGQTVAADISVTYLKKGMTTGDKKSNLCIGLNISNIGAKMSYNKAGGKKDFLPSNLRLGAAWDLILDNYNKITFALDINKLLVPTPAVYYTDPNTGKQTLLGVPAGSSVGQGIFQSFSDAPGGGKEELREINYASGLEYWYDNVFALRTGYFWESLYKGNRKFFTIGFGLKYNVFHLDGAYLMPTNRQNSPLANTFRFTLGFDFDKGDAKKKPVTD